MITNLDILNKIVDDAKAEKLELRAFQANQLKTNLDLAQANVETYGHLEGLAEKLEKLDQIVGEVGVDVKSRYKYLLGETQAENQNLRDRVDAIYQIVLSQGDHINDLAKANEQLSKRMGLVSNGCGYCLRKIEAAIASDPQNIYLKQVMDAIEELGSKFD